MLEGVGPLDGLLHVLNALLAERGKHDECGHRNLRFLGPQPIASPYSVFARPISMNTLARSHRYRTEKSVTLNAYSAACLTRALFTSSVVTSSSTSLDTIALATSLAISPTVA